MTNTPAKFAIIGCGLIGQKRLAALPAGAVAMVCDLTFNRAEKLAPPMGRRRIGQSLPRSLSGITRRCRRGVRTAVDD